MRICCNSQKLLSAATCKLYTIVVHVRLVLVHWIAPGERENKLVIECQGNIPDKICAKFFIPLIGRTETSFTFYFVLLLLEASS